MRRAAILLALTACLGHAGCVTMTAPRYTVHVSNTLALREAGLAKASIGEIRSDPTSRGNVESVRARAITVASPYGSFTAYLREALVHELDHADLLDASSPLRIDGLLRRNAIAGDGNVDFGLVEAELTVSRDGVVIYRGTKSGRHEWRSSFPAEVAAPRAVANYQTGVQRLIAAFIADPEFTAALGKR
jgi:hypothetical protein